MGQILVRNVSDQALKALKARARQKGSSMEQEARELLEAAVPLSPREKLEVLRRIRARQSAIAPEISLDEIREGME